MTRNRTVAEDVVQETYKEAWKSFHGYEPGSDCKAWLFRILFRTWKRQWKSRQQFSPVDFEDLPEGELAVDPGVHATLERRELLKVLQSLPDHYQTVLVLADVEEFTYREIADLTELPIGTVMSRLNRARTLFRAKLQEAGETRTA